MGLDLVDIAFCVEKAFGVSLSEDDLDALVSDRDILVGDLYDLILEKLHLRDVARHDFGLNHALWTEMQGVLCRVTQVPPDWIELKTRLATLFPRKTRCKTWEALRKACPFRNLSAAADMLPQILPRTKPILQGFEQVLAGISHITLYILA